MPRHAPPRVGSLPVCQSASAASTSIARRATIPVGWSTFLGTSVRVDSVYRTSGMSKKRDRLKANLGAFLRQYGRRGPSRIDANDRKYSRKIEEAVNGMDPIELDRILRGENEDSREQDS